MRILLALACVVFCLVFFTPAVAGQERADFRALDREPPRTGAPDPALKAQPRGALLPTAGGVLAHVAAGGPWRTRIVLFNSDPDVTAEGTLTFYRSTGETLRLTLTNGRKTVNASSFSISLPPRNTMFLETVDQTAATEVGYADLKSEAGKLTGYGIFRAVVPGAPNLEAVVPLEWGVSDEVLLAYDNTGGFVTSVAVANRWLLLPFDLRAEVYTEDGAFLASYHRPLAGGTHTAFETPREWPATAGRRGMVRLSRIGSIGGFAALALLFNPTGSVTTAPVIDLP